MPRPVRISFDDFAAHPDAVFDRVVRDHAVVVVERGKADRAILRPVAGPSHRGPRRKTPADYEAARLAAGSWKDVDVDSFLADLAASRSQPPRPPVDL